MECRVSDRETPSNPFSASNLVNRLQEQRKPGAGNFKIMSLQMFHREHKKLQEQYQKHLDHSALAGVEKDAGSGHRAKHMTTTQFDATEASLQAQRRTKPTRYETQEELRDIAESTRQLTAILQLQLQELQSKGWNSTVIEAQGAA